MILSDIKNVSVFHTFKNIFTGRFKTKQFVTLLTLHIKTEEVMNFRVKKKQHTKQQQQYFH